MADVYGSPYLPSFVRNQPKIVDPSPATALQALPTRACQITSVNGWVGARSHAGMLTNGSSEIVAESDPNVPRVYVIVVDQNGQQYVQGFKLIPEEEPKPITMDDLNDKMNKVLDRLNQLEEERKMNHDQSNFRDAGQNKPGSGNGNTVSRSPQNSQRPAGSAVQNGGNKPAGEAND